MSTDYDIYIKAPELTNAEAVIDILEAMGGRRPGQIFGSESPDRWQIDFDDLGTVDVFNERLDRSETAHDDVPMYDYDFCITAWVQFEDDGPDRRAAVLHLADALSQAYPVVVVYNSTEVVAIFDIGGKVLKFNDSLGYVVNDIINSPVLDMLAKEGISRKQLGIPDA